jgi:hypothetical protein
MTRNRSYSELSRLQTFEERFEYLKLEGGIGRATFGFDRYINQQFYTSREWQDIRHEVIVRDDGCDLGVPGYEIHVNLLIHHMNPMDSSDILHHEAWILDPEFLVLTWHRTHNDIHFGRSRSYPKVVTERRPDDTKLWVRR